MTKIEDPPLRSPKRTPDLASRWRTGGDGGSVSWNVIILSPRFFSPKIWLYSIRVGVCRATRWGQPTWARLGGRRALVGCVHPGAPLRWLLAPEILLFCIKKSSQSFVPFRELLFLHKNNTMVVLLKTTSVQVSFIQIIQITVQNKRKSVRKSRYVGDVSTPQA